MLMRPCGAHGPREVRSRCIERIGSLQAKLQEQLREGQGSDPIRLGGSVKTNQTVERIMISKLTARITAHKDVINGKVGGNIKNKTSNLMNRFMKDLDSEARLGKVSREEKPRRGPPPDEHSSAELAAPEPANRIRMTRIDNHRSRKATVRPKTKGGCTSALCSSGAEPACRESLAREGRSDSEAEGRRPESEEKDPTQSRGQHVNS